MTKCFSGLISSMTLNREVLKLVHHCCIFGIESLIHITRLNFYRFGNRGTIVSPCFDGSLPEQTADGGSPLIIGCHQQDSRTWWCCTFESSRTGEPCVAWSSQNAFLVIVFCLFVCSLNNMRMATVCSKRGVPGMYRTYSILVLLLVRLCICSTATSSYEYSDL